MGTDDQLLQILHALHLWQENPPHIKKTSVREKKKKNNKEKKKFSSNTNQRKKTDRQNEWEPPRGTTFLFGYYLKGNHENIHAKEATKYVFRYEV